MPSLISVVFLIDQNAVLLHFHKEYRHLRSFTEHLTIFISSKFESISFHTGDDLWQAPPAPDNDVVATPICGAEPPRAKRRDKCKKKHCLFKLFDNTNPSLSDPCEFDNVRTSNKRAYRTLLGLLNDYKNEIIRPIVPSGKQPEDINSDPNLTGYSIAGSSVAVWMPWKPNIWVPPVP